jgi:hypothetical protein
VFLTLDADDRMKAEAFQTQATIDRKRAETFQTQAADARKKAEAFQTLLGVDKHLSSTPTRPTKPAELTTRGHFLRWFRRSAAVGSGGTSGSCSLHRAR